MIFNIIANKNLFYLIVTYEYQFLSLQSIDFFPVFDKGIAANRILRITMNLTSTNINILRIFPCPLINLNCLLEGSGIVCNI